MPRPRQKAVVDLLPGLDSRKISRSHGLTPGGFSRGHEFATPLLDVLGRPSNLVRISLRADDLVEVTVGELVPRLWPVSVVRTSLRSNGGWRWWWECPTCGRRCAVLYLRQAEAPGCRCCLGLVYDGQSKSALARAIDRTHKVYRRLGWHPGRPETWVRPKRMWTRTFLRLTDQISTGWGKTQVELDKCRWASVD